MIKTFLFLLTFIVGCSNETTLDIEGRLAVKGSSRYHYLNINDINSNINYKISNKTSFDLINKQNQIVKIKASIIKQAVGAGYPAVIEVIEVK